MTPAEFTARIADTTLRGHVERVGTPCYLYFDELLRERAEHVTKAVGDLLHIHYAFKANPHRDILRRFAAAGFGADVASGGELQLALDTGYAPEKIEFSGPGKRQCELDAAIRARIGAINVESAGEFAAAADAARRLQVVGNIGIRLNLGSRISGGGLRMAGATQFGVSEEEAREILRRFGETPHVRFVGFHSHSGSQLLQVDSIVAGMRATLDTALEMADAGVSVSKINCGGGWGVPYFHNQSALRLAELRAGLEPVLLGGKGRPRGAGVCPRIIVELGRYLVAEAGVYVTQVLYRKRVGDKDFVIVDGGLHHNYVLAGGMGQVIRRNFHLLCLPRDPRNSRSPGTSIVTVAGCLCTPQDILATDAAMPVLPHEGDYVVFLNAGAYGATASPQRFLSHPPPAEAVV